MDYEAPTRIGPYQVVRLLGEGGMGRVYLAKSPGSRLAAVKVVPLEQTSPGFRERFRREVKAAKKVSGPFTAPVLDADPDGQPAWLAMAYVAAPTLAEAVIQFGRLPESALRVLGAGLAEALAAIHAAGLVHRDLKPSNILVAQDGPRVIDFGISKALDGTRLTRAGTPVGTPGYLAPEQVTAGNEAAPASDVFSLGAVLAFAATGFGPFGTGSTQDLLDHVVHDQPRLDDVPPAMRSLLAACLDKNPFARPPVTALLKWFAPSDLDSLVSPQLRGEIARREHEASQLTGGRVLRPWPPTLPPDALRLTRRRVLVLAGVAGASAVAAGGTAIALADGGGTPTAASASPRPAWTYTQEHAFSSAGLALAEGTIVWWDQDMALGISAETGAHLWTGPEQVQWVGVFGSTLFGNPDDPGNTLLGVDARTGRTAFQHSTGAWSLGPDGVCDVGGGMALVDLESDDAVQNLGVQTLGVMDLSNGTILWTRNFQPSAVVLANAVTDGRGCFLLSGTTIYGLDLRTGDQRWAVPNAVAPAVDTSPVLAGDVLIVASDRILGLDTATGRRLWTGVTDEPGVVAVHGSRIYLVDGDGVSDRVRSIDARTGTVIWTTSSAVDLAPSANAQPSMSVSAELLTVSLEGFPGETGVQALRTSNGRVLWTYEAPRPQDSRSTWSALASGDTVYASSPTSLFAFTGRDARQ